jgi:superoxide reductase
MTKINQFYKCKICGNLVSVVENGNGTLVCCGEPMTLLKEKTEESGNEKHVPVIEEIEGGVKVKVGEIPHPMEESHYIELIQLIQDGNIVYGKRLKPGDKPEAIFYCVNNDGLVARALCNIHGLWKN